MTHRFRPRVTIACFVPRLATCGEALISKLIAADVQQDVPFIEPTIRKQERRQGLPQEACAVVTGLDRTAGAPSGVKRGNCASRATLQLFVLPVDSGAMGPRCMTLAHRHRVVIAPGRAEYPKRSTLDTSASLGGARFLV